MASKPKLAEKLKLYIYIYIYIFDNKGLPLKLTQYMDMVKYGIKKRIVFLNELVHV